jgi:RNA polymerase sigma-70 factor (ECF subfamily)
MGNDPSTAGTGAPWPTTLWPLVRNLEEPGHKKLASEILAARYWRPVYAFLRRKGYDHHRASDFTQDFFLALFSRDWALRADETRGKFRTFLITLLVRYVRDLREKRQARFEEDQRGLPFEIRETDARLVGWSGAGSDEIAFWRQYVRDLLDHAIEALRREADSGSGVIDTRAFRIFEQRIEGQVEGKKQSWSRIAEAEGLSEDRARYAFKKCAARFREHLAYHLGEEGHTAGEFQGALAELFELIHEKPN